MPQSEGRVMRGFQFAQSSGPHNEREAKADSRSGKIQVWSKTELNTAMATHAKMKGIGRTRELIVQVLGGPLPKNLDAVQPHAYGYIIAALCHDMIDRRNAALSLPPREEA